VNGSTLDVAGWTQFLVRYAWMCTVFGGAVVVMGLARRGARRAVAAGLRAGQAAQRADMLRQMHDTVLQTLEGLALTTSITLQSTEERLREAQIIALAQARELRAMLHEDAAAAQAGLDTRLYTLSQEFGRRGVHIDLMVTGALGSDPPRQVLEAIEGAVREALANIAKHAGVTRAAVHATITDGSIEVSVSDHGRGFDPTLPTTGYGLARSIRARMTEAGGTTAVWSAPGKGTHVRLRVDAPSEAAGWIGFPMVWLARLRTSVAAAPSTAGADALAAPTFSWFAVAVLAYRVAVVPIVAVSSLAIVPGEIPPATLAVMLGPLLIANLALLIGALTGRLRGWLESNALLGVDILIAVAIDLWVSSLIRPGSFYLMGRDIFLAYPLSVVVLWTTLRGARTGLMLLAGTVLLELAMGVVNGVELDAISWPEFLSRLATSCLAVVLPLVVMSFARQGGRLQAAEGLRAGREAERARLLRDTHEAALHTLETIAARADAGESPAAQLREVQALALGQAAELRAVLQADAERSRGGLAVGLRALVQESRGNGLTVELVTNELDENLPIPVSTALLDAARLALTPTSAQRFGP